MRGVRRARSAGAGGCAINKRGKRGRRGKTSKTSKTSKTNKTNKTNKTKQPAKDALLHMGIKVATKATAGCRVDDDEVANRDKPDKGILGRHNASQGTLRAFTNDNGIVPCPTLDSSARLP